MNRIVRLTDTKEGSANFRVEYSINPSDSEETYYADIQNTWNCQIAYMHGIDDLLEIVRDNKENNAIILNQILAKCYDRLGKQLVLVDASNISKNTLEELYGDILHSIMDYKSTNGNNRHFILLNVYKARNKVLT